MVHTAQPGVQSWKYGICYVTIPARHQFGHLESYRYLNFEVKNHPDNHVTLVSVQPSSEGDFVSRLQGAVAESVRKEILVFIHGYNMSFEDGARRAAQVAYDLGFDKARGAPVLYSWPSQAAFEQYIQDETNIRVTVHHLRALLTNLVTQSGAQSIHLMAHSMGNQALAEALELMGTEMAQTNKAPFNQVIMAAPDIDVDLLVNMSPAIRKTASRFTIYSCEEDLPVRLSKWLHGDLARVGSFAVLDGFDTIDTTRQVLEGLLKHTYFADVPSILWDIRNLLECGRPASERCCCCFETREAEQRKYWVFKAGAVEGCTHRKTFGAP